MKSITAILIGLVFPVIAFAHGGEDHGHDEASATPVSASGAPRVEASTESFEVVGTFDGHELVLVVDRFDSNEPVLNGNVEVEVNGAKSLAKFRPAQSDYVVDDKALLNALAKPGKYSFIFTVAAGSDSDLLEGVMQVLDDGAGMVSHAAADKEIGLSLANTAVGGVVLAIILAAIGALLIRRNRVTEK